MKPTKEGGSHRRKEQTYFRKAAVSSSMGSTFFSGVNLLQPGHLPKEMIRKNSLPYHSDNPD